MSNYVAADKDTANRYRTARGFASFRAWGGANRQAANSFASRKFSPSEDKDRMQTLIDLLDADYDRYIRPNI